PRLALLDPFAARRVCIGHFSATSSAATVAISTGDRYANLLAAMTDAGDYLAAVMGFDMPKISVLTGWQSAKLSAVNGVLSFTSCLGRLPNLVESLVALGASADPVVGVLLEIAEFVSAYDIVMNPEDSRSRGIGVHEYGHAFMCELLRQVDQVKAS